MSGRYYRVDKKKISVLLFCVIALVSFLFWVAQKEKKVEKLYIDFSIEKIDYTSFSAWENDDHFLAVETFVRSCSALNFSFPERPLNPQEYLGVSDIDSLSGTVQDWKFVCDEAAVVTVESARRFWEDNFTPFIVKTSSDKKEEQSTHTAIGLFTGYFEPFYRGSKHETSNHTAPVYARPKDLVMVDLGLFREDLSGKRIAGSIKNGSLVPYADHAEIATDGIDSEILGWMNPNDLLFLQIQGSGRVLFDETEVRLGYAGQNGHVYTAIGRPLIEAGEIAREDISMQSIYDWLDTAKPEDAERIRLMNRSYVFFRELDNLPSEELGPIGAQGVQLTTGRSLAVDRRYYAMGTPIWIEIEGTGADVPRIERLVIAQDTGGAIKGAIRGDVFIGSGQEAGMLAGKMKQDGKMIVLLPNNLAAKIMAK